MVNNNITDLISSRFLQKMREMFISSFGINLEFLDPNNLALLIDSGENLEFCCKFNLKPYDCAFYKDCQNKIISPDRDKIEFFDCAMGLSNFVFNLSLDGKNLAYIVGGPVRIRDVEFNKCELKAKELNMTSDKYLQDYLEVPYLDREKFAKLANFIKMNLSSLLSLQVQRNEEKLRADKAVSLKDGLEKKIIERTNLLSDIEVKYDELVDNLPDIVYSVDNRDRFISINCAVEKILGYLRSEIIGQLFVKIGDVSEEANLKKAFTDAVEGKNILLGFIFKARTKKGEIKYLSLSSRRTFDENGKLLRIEGMMRDVTKEKELSEQLEKSTNRYKGLVDNAPDIICVLNNSNIIDSVNSAVFQKTEYLPEELIGRDLLEFVAPEDLDRVASSFNDLRLKNRKFIDGLQFRFQSKNGNYGFYEINCRGFYDESDEYVGLEGVLHDISREIDLRKNLLIANERYRSIFDSFKEGRYIMDMHSRFMMVNKVFLEIFHLDSENDILGRKASELYVDPAEREFYTAELLKKGKVESYVVQVKDSRNNPFYIQINSSLLKNSVGECIGIYGKIKKFEEAFEDFNKKRGQERVVGVFKGLEPRGRQADLKR